MSDSLVLKGAKDVRKQKGSELLLMRPKRGGDFQQVKKWWATSPNNTVYVGCSVFKVTTGAGVCYLAIDTNEMSTIRVDLDDNFNFSFFILSQVSRAALFTEDWEIIEHYMFPKIAKGPVTTVIPPGAAPKPSPAPPAPTIGTVTITGTAAVTDGDTETYTVSASGSASPPFVLTSSEPGDVIFFDSYCPHKSKKNNTNKSRRVLYITYNKLEDGDHRRNYYNDKRLNYPQDCERDPKKKYEYLV